MTATLTVTFSWEEVKCFGPSNGMSCLNSVFVTKHFIPIIKTAKINIK